MDWTKLFKGFKTFDVLMDPGLPGSRPIRRSVDLFKRYALHEDWEAFENSQRVALEKAVEAGEKPSDLHRILEILIMCKGCEESLDEAIEPPEENLELPLKDPDVIRPPSELDKISGPSKDLDEESCLDAAAEPEPKKPKKSRKSETWANTHVVELDGQFYGFPVIDSEEHDDKPVPMFYKSWREWLRNRPEEDWFRPLLRAHLEMWSLQAPKKGREKLRKAFPGFAEKCVDVDWKWADHKNAEARIESLKEYIDTLETPIQDWTPSEVQILGGHIREGSLAYLLSRSKSIPKRGSNLEMVAPPPYMTRKMSEPKTELEAAVARFVIDRYGPLEELDIASWPIDPDFMNLNGQKIAIVYRSRAMESRVPRIREAFGLFNIHTYINELEPDEKHSKYIGEVNWSNDRAVIFDASSGLIIRTWANRKDPRLTWDLRDIPCTKNCFQVRKHAASPSKHFEGVVVRILPAEEESKIVGRLRRANEMVDASEAKKAAVK